MCDLCCLPRLRPLPFARRALHGSVPLLRSTASMSATETVSSRAANEPVSATLFTGKSNAYARYRPSYPAEAIDCILAPFGDARRVQVVDIGAGTGIASRQLAERGARVLGVEPNASMIET